MREERTLVPLEVSEQTRQQLESIRHSRSQPNRLSQRAEIVLLAADGWPNQAIASALEISPTTVGKWCRQFKEQGLEGIGFYDEVCPEGELSPPYSDSDSTDINSTIECLLNLRSVRDQFADAGLDPSSGELAKKLAILEDRLVDQIVAQREYRDGVGLLTVAVIGDFNSGKSTFINALLGTDLCPVGEEPTTSSATHFIHGDKERIEQQLPDGERKPIEKSKYRSLVRHDKKEDREPYIFHISVNSSILEHIRLVDTPGFNAPPPNTNDTKVTENALTEADALFVLIDTRKGNPTKSLLEQLDRLQQTKEDEFHPPMFLLLNKAENLSPTQRTEVKSVCQTRYSDRFHDVTLISALQLNNSDAAAPLDALQTAQQQVRDAIMRRDPFEAQISAKVVTGTRTAIYRMDINGNVYEVPTVSASSLASREQLCEMVRSVSAERHVLLERQFQRKTSQLREDWQKTLSTLDYELKLALGEYTGVNDGTDDTKSNALEAIDKAKFDIIELFSGICKEVLDEMVTKDQRLEERFWSDRTFYQIRVRLDKASEVAKNHDNWTRMSDRYDKLLSFLKRLTGISSEPSQNMSVAELKKEFLGFIREIKKAIKKDLGQYEHWTSDRRGDRWLVEYDQDDYVAREEHYTRMSSVYRESGDECILAFTQDIQTEIDLLKEAVVRDAERSLSRDQERAEELDRLQQRINELREHMP